MNEKLKTQKLICKIQILGSVTLVLSFFVSVALSGLLWYLHHLHPLVMCLLAFVFFAVLSIGNNFFLKKAKIYLYKKLEDFIYIDINEIDLSKILLNMSEYGVFNVTKQNRFLFIKSNLDNFAFYDINGVNDKEEIKRLYGENMATLKKNYPDIKNKYLCENHLRLNVQIFVSNSVDLFLKSYITSNKNKLFDIGHIRCAIDTTNSTIILPSFLPNGIGIHDSVFYLKVVNFLSSGLSTL